MKKLAILPLVLLLAACPDDDDPVVLPDADFDALDANGDVAPDADPDAVAMSCEELPIGDACQVNGNGANACPETYECRALAENQAVEEEAICTRSCEADDGEADEACGTGGICCNGFCQCGEACVPWADNGNGNGNGLPLP